MYYERPFWGSIKRLLLVQNQESQSRTFSLYYLNTILIIRELKLHYLLYRIGNNNTCLSTFCWSPNWISPIMEYP